MLVIGWLDAKLFESLVAEGRHCSSDANNHVGWAPAAAERANSGISKLPDSARAELRNTEATQLLGRVNLRIPAVGPFGPTYQVGKTTRDTIHHSAIYFEYSL